MSAPKLTKWIPAALKKFRTTQNTKTKSPNRTMIGIQDLIQQEKVVQRLLEQVPDIPIFKKAAEKCDYAPVNICIEPVAIEQHQHAVQMIKEHFLKEHVLVRAQGIDFTHDHALDEYLHSLLRQGNTIYAKNADGIPVGICVNVASSPTDPENLRKYAFYRQDPNTKDFLNFTAQLQETPNLWEVFKVSKIFEVGNEYIRRLDDYINV